MRRLVVTGSECTGKTTLARALGGWLGVPWVPEAARAVAEAAGRDLTASDVDVIARRHVADADDAQRRAGSANLVVLDTDLLSTVVYARHYYGACPAWIESDARARRADLYLLAVPDLPWQPDGVRDRPTQRQEMHDRFVATLREFGATWVPVSGSGSLRLNRAIAAVRGWRAASTMRRD